MKYILMFCLMLQFTGKAFSQKDSVLPNSSRQTDYLQKSKNQKTFAWVLLGGGTVLIGTGIVVGQTGNANASFDNAATGAALIIAGALIDIGSIPLFIASARNKRKALTVSFKNEFIPKIRQDFLVRKPIPTLNIAIRL